ncbi:hypothetical protein M8C21_020640 [Ambrosia artemisiifolia]|uniref:Uncharacterized protein n=1 Tax=Ambrosia artemisiifolia TaxID=4212 RepID=A0AAD5C1Z4_AMBAR|nr:hypothetical protein M8C21_020640 [Ambrosia artemisiifolia]
MKDLRTDMDATTSGPSRKRARKGAAVEDPDIDPIIDEDDPEIAALLSGEDLLNFGILTQAYSKYDRMRNTPLLAGRTIDWELMGRLGVRERLETVIPARWRPLFDIPDEQYRVFTLEFFSTFTYSAGKKLTDETAVTFRLGGQLRRMSVAQFARTLHLHTQEEIEQTTFTDIPRRFADPRPLALVPPDDQGTSQSHPRRSSASQPRRAPLASDPPATLASVRDEVREVREEVRSLTDWVVQALRDIAAER